MEKPDALLAETPLAAYRNLLDNARDMFLAAREERWDDLLALDADRERVLSGVVEADLISTRPGDIEARNTLIQSILEYDEQTKALVHAWQGELTELLGSMDNERKLADAYQDS